MILKDQIYCPACGTKLVERPLEGEGVVPYCEQCGEYRFPKFNVAVSMIVRDTATGKILLIQQYGRPFYILVTGYINRGEQAEHAAIREMPKPSMPSPNWAPFSIAGPLRAPKP